MAKPVEPFKKIVLRNHARITGKPRQAVGYVKADTTKPLDPQTKLYVKGVVKENRSRSYENDADLLKGLK